MDPKRKTDDTREPARTKPEEQTKDGTDPELDAQLDDELDDTFPASDPPSVTRDARSGFRAVPPLRDSAPF